MQCSGERRWCADVGGAPDVEVPITDEIAHVMLRVDVSAV